MLFLDRPITLVFRDVIKIEILQVSVLHMLTVRLVYFAHAVSFFSFRVDKRKILTR